MTLLAIPGGVASRCCALWRTTISSRRLGRRLLHMEAVLPKMPVYYSDAYTVPLPASHTFPMARYRTTYDELRSRRCDTLLIRESPAASDDEICTAHDRAYVDDFFTNRLAPAHVREIGFPITPAFHERTRKITGGTIAALHDVLQNNGQQLRLNAPALGIAGNLAGGTHHAFHDHGEGYCIFNDIAVAARLALRRSKAAPDVAAKMCEQHRVLVIDLDVHQGNGTASIFQSDERVFTFSMHAHKNYPWRTRVASDFDVDLPDKTNDEQYMNALHTALADLKLKLEASARRGRAVSVVPDSELWQDVKRTRAAHDVSLVIYQAGVDPHGDDRLGRLALTHAGLRARNEAVFAFCDRLRVPIVVTMGGGYARDIAVSAQAHADVFEEAAAAWTRRAGELHRVFHDRT